MALFDQCDFPINFYLPPPTQTVGLKNKKVKKKKKKKECPDNFFQKV